MNFTSLQNTKWRRTRTFPARYVTATIYKGPIYLIGLALKRESCDE